VADPLGKAEAADQADGPNGISIPEVGERREARVPKLAEARTKIEAPAKERDALELAAYQAKHPARAEKAEATGRKPGGKPAQPPEQGPRPTEQLTDEGSRIMRVPHSDTLGVRQPNAKVAGGGCEQCHNT
jgi:hypothetical protein